MPEIVPEVILLSRQVRHGTSLPLSQRICLAREALHLLLSKHASRNCHGGLRIMFMRHRQSSPPMWRGGAPLYASL